MKRRILSSLMALVLVFGLLPATVFAAEGETTDPFACAKTIFVSKAGGGDGTAEATPMTLPEAIKFINSYTPKDGEAAPAFIISLTENLDFECDDGALTLKKYATRILGNGHFIKTYRTIVGEGIRVDLGSPNDGKNTLTVDVKGDRPTLAIGNGAEMQIYDGITVNHTPIKPEEDPDKALTNKYGSGTHSDAAIKVQAKSNFYMHGGKVSDCTALKAIILVDGESHVEIHGGTVCDNTVGGSNCGGAIYLSDKSSLVVDGNVVFENNKTLLSDITDNLDIVGDEDKITQLMNILMDNALKYSTENGFIKVTLSKNKSSSVCLTVSNSSENIKQEQIEKIFDRFYRIDDSRNRKTGGSGLGLNIAKSIVESHKGHITAINKDNITSFIITFPV